MQERELLDLEYAAYQKAWTILSESDDLTPDERDAAPRVLRGKILRLINEGLRDPDAIAYASMGDFRQQEQIQRSMINVHMNEKFGPGEFRA